MENTFDLKKFLVENTLTANSKIIKEGRLALTPEDVKKVESIARQSAALFEAGKINEKETYYFNPYSYTLADGSPGKVKFQISYRDTNSVGTFFRGDDANLEDNVININSKVFIPAFDSFFSNIWQAVSGNTPLEHLTAVITHELIHAKDPARNHHLLKEPYDTNSVEVYYKSWTEFPTMTGQFMEAILRRTNNLVQKGITEESYTQIQTALQNILDVYSGKENTFAPATYELLTDGSEETLLKWIARIVVGTGMLITGGNPNELDDTILDQMARYISAIKQYHIDAYNEFLKDLYLTVQEAVYNVNKNLPQGFTPMQVGGRGSFKTSFKGSK